jgi:NADPH-dependent glutamate synthase beta subunit-like oxidoreductase
MNWGGRRHDTLSLAIIAIGTGANPIVQSTIHGLNTNKKGYIQADETPQRTSRKAVFACGDIGTGSATVILAMGAGRRAAQHIREYLTHYKRAPRFRGWKRCVVPALFCLAALQSKN